MIRSVSYVKSRRFVCEPRRFDCCVYSPETDFVNENVPTDGLTVDFTIQTDLGTLDALCLLKTQTRTY